MPTITSFGTPYRSFCSGCDFGSAKRVHGARIIASEAIARHENFVEPELKLSSPLEGEKDHVIGYPEQSPIACNRPEFAAGC